MITCLNDPSTGLELVSAAGGFLGGLSMLIYMRPGSFKDAVGRVVISTMAAILLATFVAEKLMGSKEAEMVMAAAFLIGFCAWSLLGATAKFFEGRQHEDIVSMMKSFNSANRPDYGGGYYRPPPTPMPKASQIDSPD